MKIFTTARWQCGSTRRCTTATRVATTILGKGGEDDEEVWKKYMDTIGYNDWNCTNKVRISLRDGLRVEPDNIFDHICVQLIHFFHGQDFFLHLELIRNNQVHLVQVAGQGTEHYS